MQLKGMGERLGGPLISLLGHQQLALQVPGIRVAGLGSGDGADFGQRVIGAMGAHVGKSQRNVYAGSVLKL